VKMSCLRGLVSVSAVMLACVGHTSMSLGKSHLVMLMSLYCLLSVWLSLSLLCNSSHKYVDCLLTHHVHTSLWFELMADASVCFSSVHVLYLAVS